MSLVLSGRISLCAVVFCVFIIHIAAGQPPVSLAALQPREYAANARIEEALAQSVAGEFVDTPLKDVVGYLANQYGVTIVLTKKIEDAGVQPDQPVTVNLRGVSLEAFLNRMLGNLNLTLMVANETLVITTVEDAQSPENMIVRVYPVRDLVGIPGQWGYDFDPLIDLITSTIEPDSWQDVGGPGSINGHDASGSLVFAQRRDIHQKIEALLTTLRRVRRLQNISTASAPLQPQTQSNEIQLSRSLKYTRRSSSARVPIAEHLAPFAGGGGLFNVPAPSSSFAPRTTTIPTTQQAFPSR